MTTSDIDLTTGRQEIVPVSSIHRAARASVRLSVGTAKFQADAEITPVALLAIGGMVGAILLATAHIVTAAGNVRRRR